MVTMTGVEGECSFGCTKLAGEIVRDRFETPNGPLAAYEWFLQGNQTLSPRWFAPARHEATSARRHGRPAPRCARSRGSRWSKRRSASGSLTSSSSEAVI
jgi:hypothetical protein